jgi:hypothetical protein
MPCPLKPFKRLKPVWRGIYSLLSPVNFKYKMKKIKQLKKKDKFKFNGKIYEVSQKFSQWKKNDDPYLKTTDGQLWYNEELEVDSII